jgi:hypothetical protein
LFLPTLRVIKFQQQIKRPAVIVHMACPMPVQHADSEVLAANISSDLLVTQGTLVLAAAFTTGISGTDPGI